MTITTPFELIKEIRLGEDEKRTTCEACKKVRLCARRQTVAGKRYLCRFCREWLTVDGYILFLMSLYGDRDPLPRAEDKP